jgi:hypothetical protein
MSPGLRSAKTRVLVGLITVVAVTLGVLGASGVASATASVTIPSGPFTDGQTITVSGSGFPAESMLPTGLEIIECEDPGGSMVNLPTDPSVSCDGTTVNGSQINTDASGNFSTTYSLVLLNSGDSSINCDATDFCVLWVGQDYNGAFLSGPHAFSAPFEINAPKATAAEVPTAVILPVAAAMVVGAYVFIRRRRATADPLS